MSDHWTLEYDLARSGLAEEVWIAVHLADCDVDLHRGVRSTLREVVNARRSFSELKEQVADSETLASHVYSWFTRGQVSKAIAAQYLSEILEYEIRSGRLSPDALLSGFPRYLRGAIEYVTRPAGTTEGVEKGPSN